MPRPHLNVADSYQTFFNVLYLVQTAIFGKSARSRQRAPAHSVMALSSSLMALGVAGGRPPSVARSLHIQVNVTLPADGHVSNLGSLFELRSAAGDLVAHAGSSYASSTWYSGPSNQLNFFVNASNAPAAEWTDLGQPFPGVCCETRVVAAADTLYAVNYGVPEHDENVAKLESDGSWTRLSRKAATGVAPWGGAVEACGASMAFERMGITLNGTWIYDLPAQYDHMFGHYHNGRVLIYAMTVYAANSIMVGSYTCGEAKVRVRHAMGDPAGLPSHD